MGRKGGKRRKAAGIAPAADVGAGLSGVARLLVETPVATLDLHGCTARQAESRLRDFLRTRSVDGSGRVVHVITGRGNRSEGAPILPGLVRELLASDLSHLVGASVGLPGGGGVAIRLR